MKHDYSEGSQSQNKYGEYVPSIPLPYYTGAWFLFTRFACWTCPERPVFKKEDEYRGHYALVHILGL